MKKYLAGMALVSLIAYSTAYCAVSSEKLSGELKGGVRVVEVTASRYTYAPDPIVVKLGERVRLVATSTDVAHGLSLPEFKLNVSIPVNKTVTADFIAGKEGSFQFYCNVYCGPGHVAMRGTLKVVKE